MNHSIIVTISIASLIVMFLVGSLPRQIQSFSNDPTSEIKKAGYWKTRTWVKVGTLIASIVLAAVLLLLMMQNY